ncbi:MAG: aspartate aminotransferase family protein [Acidobacteria bacterium]|nr:aspartate aminotransferase family protein [Acidobacteriota bacterium]
MPLVNEESATDTFEKYRKYVITSFVKSVAPVVIEKAKGAVITGIDGREYIDCFSGISVVNAGHCNPRVIEAAKAQMDKLVHGSSYLFHVQPTADLAEKMARIAPAGLTKSFFGNSGAEAIEGALKLARLHTGRHEFIALQGGFHGRSWGALSISGYQGRKKGGGPYAPGVSFAPVPYPYRSQWPGDADECGRRSAAAIEELIHYATSNDVAAFIAEPVLGEGGIIVPPFNYFREVKKVLDRHGILFIADEVQSGFARTGKMFAIEHYGVVPDILATAKGIADGFPLSAFTTREDIAAAFKVGDHLSTFGGNPVSCAAACANIDFIEEEGLCENARNLGEFARSCFRELERAHPLIGEVRGLGLMIGIELVRDGRRTPAAAEAAALKDRCLESGLIVGLGGTFANVIRFQPPLVITREQVDRAINIFSEALEEPAH